MLEALYLTRSKIRQRLFGFFFSNTGKDYYLSELARHAGTSAGNVQRELLPFIKDGLVHRSKRGKLTFYSLNPRHTLYPEIKSLVLKTVGVEGALKSLVGRDKDIKLALMYGSFAQAREHGQSDIDLLVVSEGKLKEFYGALSKLESRFSREVNPTVYSKKAFREKIAAKDVFISHVLSQPFRVLKGTVDEYRK